jgi:hypothetical protein
MINSLPPFYSRSRSFKVSLKVFKVLPPFKLQDADFNFEKAKEEVD